ncbi:hypothetical protein KTQ42_22020 [Noviherbaspirillum sp. L7-7A]|uniref:hypothetical protein n=1 Tax=Noviherbaspirillum sp. L7-7A TaxID=2850560 RepID=UPI001C2C2AF0|nr:hypothetical protein [Noviherbaspirillum sp. L7-7A]MBV0881958.1 hypothetical protein [Noviherbaspirillum sp. L7-7A]
MTAMLASSQRKEKTVPRKRNRLAGRISVLGEDGVSAQLAWQRGSHEDSQTAARLFAQLYGKSYHAFALCGGHSARRIDAFSPALGEVILTPGQSEGWEDCGLAAWRASTMDARGLLRSAMAYITGMRPAARTGPAQQGPKRRGKRQALCILLAMLSDDQRRSLRQSACIELRGAASGTVYRLRAREQAEIEQLDREGKVQYRLHIPAPCMLPLHAALLVHVLHLRDPESEHAYLSGATILADEN